MKAPAFKYVRPQTLQDCLSELEQHGDEAQVLAGGSLRRIGPEQADQRFPTVRLFGLDGQVGQQRPAPIRLNRGHGRTVEGQLKATQ